MEKLKKFFNNLPYWAQVTGCCLFVVSIFLIAILVGTAMQS